MGPSPSPVTGPSSSPGRRGRFTTLVRMPPPEKYSYATATNVIANVAADPRTATTIPDGVRDLAPDVIGDDGRMRILPAEFWAGTTMNERALFGHSHGIYSFPTVELVEHLRTVIGTRTAIEIGAGHGVLADALGIPSTDSRQQEHRHFRTILRTNGTPPVRYGPNVEHLDAAAAVRKYKPNVVIGCWVTHRFDPARPQRGGNEVGVDEADVIAHCDTYVFVGNTFVHRQKPIWGLTHRKIYPPFVYSRASNGSREFIATWRRSPRRTRRR